MMRRSWDIGLTIGLAIAMAIATLTPIPNAVPVPGSDKLHHVLAFILLCLPLAMTRPKRLHWLILGAAIYGGAIELIQPHIGRSGEWADFWADCIGIAGGVVLGRLAARFLPYFPPRSK
jgi:hypothetical protein